MPVDYFLKLEGIPGESQDDKHKDEIDILSWGWGESQTGAHDAGGGGGAGKVHLDDFLLRMQVNKASPKVFLACAKGTHIKEALLTCRKAGGGQQEYLKIKLTDLLVSSYRTDGTGGGDIPIETISLNFSKIRFSYFPQKPDGTLGPEVGHEYDRKHTKGS